MDGDNLATGVVAEVSQPQTWARLDLGRGTESTDRLSAALEEIEATAPKDPVGAYRALLDLLDEGTPGPKAGARIKRLRRILEKKKEVASEAAAQRRLESALRLLRKKLREVEERHPDTRAADIARARREALDA